MNSKERIDAVLNGQKVDRTPFTVVDCGAFIAMNEGLSYEQMYSLPDAGAELVAKWFDQLDCDVISAVSGVFTACLNAFGCPMKMDEVGTSADIGPALLNPEVDIPLLDKSTIRDTLLSNTFVQQMITQTKNIKKLSGDKRYLVGDIAGPFTMAAVMVGTSNFIMMLLDEPELVEELLDFTVDVSAEMFNILHENGCDIALPAEPIASGSMISFDMFEEWVVPCIEKLKAKLGDYKYVFTHVCGASGSRVDSLERIGINAFSGDYSVDLDQALIDGKNKMAIMGNINPAGVLLSGTPEEVYAEACERIKTANGRQHILSTGCDVGASTPLANLLMMRKACEDMAI